ALLRGLVRPRGRQRRARHAVHSDRLAVARPHADRHRAGPRLVDAGDVVAAGRDLVAADGRGAGGLAVDRHLRRRGAEDVDRAGVVVVLRALVQIGGRGLGRGGRGRVGRPAAAGGGGGGQGEGEGD